MEAAVADYFEMLALELAGRPYNKSEHRRALSRSLRDRPPQAIEFKHCNISAVLIASGFPYISGYKPRSKYQRLLKDVVLDRLLHDQALHQTAAIDAVQKVTTPSVSDILTVLREPPKPNSRSSFPDFPEQRGINYLELEAKNRLLGMAGEEFAFEYERTRLVSIGCEGLASKIEHVSREVGDGLGFDIRSFEANGSDRLIEVKTTKHGCYTPFFVSRNEVRVSEKEADKYHLYRLFDFKRGPGLFTLQGALTETCVLQPTSFEATVT